MSTEDTPEETVEETVADDAANAASPKPAPKKQSAHTFMLLTQWTLVDPKTKKRFTQHQEVNTDPTPFIDAQVSAGLMTEVGHEDEAISRANKRISARAKKR